MCLPAYEPPEPRRAVVACAGAPLVVLAVFVALVLGAIDLELAGVWMLGATVWVGWEMQDYQRALDGYNRAYVQAHLAGRTPAQLRAWAEDPALPGETREFLSDYVAAGCRCEPDRPRL